MPKSTFKYTNGDVTVVWKPDTCIHSRICWTQLRAVFDPAKRPWINMEGSDTATIIEQVSKCPSGALSYIMNNAAVTTTEDATKNPEEVVAREGELIDITISKNGPILVKTDCHITHSDGTMEIKQGVTALCRCGASANKPYCDGTHRKIGFEG